MRDPDYVAHRPDSGFSLVELVMALFVLAFGVLGMATTTMFITRQLTLSEVTTARAIALQSTMERIHATPFDSINTGQATLGPVAVSWSVAATAAQTKSVRIVTVGPGQVTLSAGQSFPMLSNAVADTLIYTVLRP